MSNRRSSSTPPCWPSIWVHSVAQKASKIAPKTSFRMHLPSGASTVTITPSSATDASATPTAPTEWDIYKDEEMLEPPAGGNNNAENSSPSPGGSGDLWWIERLVIEAQQEYPGELGKSYFRILPIHNTNRSVPISCYRLNQYSRNLNHHRPLIDDATYSFSITAYNFQRQKHATPDAFG